MAITKKPSGRYQARIRGSDGRILSRVFDSRREAQHQERQWKQHKSGGGFVSSGSTAITVAGFYAQWWEDNQHESSQSGWRKTQAHYFRDYILPVLGPCRLGTVTPAMVGKVFAEMTKQGFSTKTQSLVYGTLRMFFGAAVENYQLIVHNPVIRKLQPKEAVKEAAHLSLNESRVLLSHVTNRPFELAVWVQLLAGLRAGELFGLAWEDISLEERRLVVRRVYVKATSTVRPYPKSRKQRVVPLPQELLEKLAGYKRGTSGFLFPQQKGEYQRYLRALAGYCLELGLPKIGTHAIRHSSAAVYLAHAANKEDLQAYFGHSTMKMTERYIHGWESKVGAIARTIKLFPEPSLVPQMYPEESFDRAN